jgi:hypothetical protein
MTWNVTQLQERFARRDRTLESEIPQLRKKASQNDSYKRIHDRQIGVHQVFIILSASAALASREALVAALLTMRKDGPFQTTGAFDERNVKPGWDEALDTLLSEFSKM